MKKKVKEKKILDDGWILCYYIVNKSSEQTVTKIRIFQKFQKQDRFNQTMSFKKSTR